MKARKLLTLVASLEVAGLRRKAKRAFGINVK